MSGTTEYLTPGDAAIVVGCSAQTIRNAADEGRLRTAGRTLSGVGLFLRAEVERWAKARGKAARR